MCKPSNKTLCKVLTNTSPQEKKGIKAICTSVASNNRHSESCIRWRINKHSDFFFSESKTLERQHWTLFHQFSKQQLYCIPIWLHIVSSFLLHKIRIAFFVFPFPFRTESLCWRKLLDQDFQRLNCLRI